jgi:2-polyprenyl-3-methyl-5-hydroxy-6-metoxy-1,4-benzoquinol methylase
MPAEGQVSGAGHVRAFAASRRLVARIHNLCDAIHQGLWLGLLDGERWQDITDEHYAATSRRRTGDVNYFSDTHNMRGFYAWEQEAYDAHFTSCRSVLVGSAGGGREALAVARRGVKVDAFECNRELVEVCRSMLSSQQVDATVTLAAVNEVPDSFGTYDGAIVGWGSYIHIVGRARRVALLRAYRRHLRPGGPLLLSFFLEEKSTARRIPYILGRTIRAVRFAPPIERGDAFTTTFNHHFTEQAIREELAEAGFEVLHYGESRFGHAVARARP